MQQTDFKSIPFLQMYLGFDALIERAFPSTFPYNFLTNRDRIAATEQLHAIIIKILYQLPLMNGTYSDFELKNRKLIHYSVDIPHPDEGCESEVKIPLYIETINQVITPDQVLNQLRAIPSQILSNFSELGFSLQQIQRIVDMHLAIIHLIENFETNLIFGRGFFQTDYALNLLKEVFPTTSTNQALRFYYWGILKFNSGEDLTHWQNWENFRAYMKKFRD